MGKGLAWWVAYGVAVASAMASTFPLELEWGTQDTGNDSAQAAFRLLQSSTPAPVAQRLSGRGTAPWIVQGAAVARGEWQQALEAAGAVIRGYLPENALLIEAAPTAVPKIAALDGVAWMGEYLPAYKKSPALAGAKDGDRECLVALFDPADKRRVALEFGEMNVFVPRAQFDADGAELRVRLTAAQIDEVANWTEVEWIAPDPKPRAWGASAPETTGTLPEAFDQGRRIHLERQGLADSGAYGAAARAIDRFVWEHPEMLVVAAAGNAAVDLQPADGVVDSGSVGSPATAKNALAVGAAEGRRDVARTWVESWPEDFAVEPIATDRMAQADGPQGLAAFSGRGPCADGRIKPDLVAPGTFVVAPRPADADFTGWGAKENTDEIFVGGTGVAAEQVAEAARQARQWLVEQRGIESPSAALVKALLLAGARNLAPGQYGTGAKQEIPDVRPNNAQGFGLLDLEHALSPGAGEAIELHDAPGLAAGAADVYELPAQAAGDRFVLVLAYSDRPAAPAASKKLVNDLDLTVTAPDGAVLCANGRKSTDGASGQADAKPVGTEPDPPENRENELLTSLEGRPPRRPGSFLKSPDDLNNVEMIEFEADIAGVYLAQVTARAVPLGGSQPYALVVRGPRAPAAAAAPSETK